MSISHSSRMLHSEFFKNLGFTPRKAEQPPRVIELQGKEAEKDYSRQEICLERTYR